MSIKMKTGVSHEEKVKFCTVFFNFLCLYGQALVSCLPSAMVHASGRRRGTAVSCGLVTPLRETGASASAAKPLHSTLCCWVSENQKCILAASQVHKYI